MSTENPPSDTPETDSQLFQHCDGVPATFARNLERQRNALRAFAQEIMRGHPMIGCIDSGELQELATRHGLLADGSPTPLLTGEKL